MTKTAGGVTTEFVGSLFEKSAGRVIQYIFLGSTRIASITKNLGVESVMYYHADHLGGANVMTDQAGDVKERTEYQPFGATSRHDKYGSSDEVAHFYFTGHYKDEESNLIYMGARYYDPSLGRFLTADTIVQSPGNPQTFNRYSYTGNNPVNFTDPDGHGFWKSLFKAIVDFFLPFIPDKNKGAVAGIALTLVGLAPLGAAVSSALNTYYNGGNFRDFARGFGISILTAGVGGAIGDVVGGSLGGLAGSAAAGAIAGGIGSALTGGSFGDGAGQGAMFAAAGYLAVTGIQAAVSKVESVRSAKSAKAKTGTSNAIGDSPNTPTKSLDIDAGAQASGKQALSTGNEWKFGENIGPGGFYDENGMFRVTIGEYETANVKGLENLMYEYKAHSMVNKFEIANKVSGIVSHYSNSDGGVGDSFRGMFKIYSASKTLVESGIRNSEAAKIENILNTKSLFLLN